MGILAWLRLVFAPVVTLSLVGCSVSVAVKSAPSPSPDAPAPSSNPTPAEFATVNARMIELHNAERAKTGLAPLAPDGRLALAAWLQAQDCARRDVMSHTGSDGSNSGTRITRVGYVWARCAENAAEQPKAPTSWPGPDVRTAEWAVRGWIQSPGHHANMIGPYTQMGCGWADSASGTRYWIVDFGKPF